MKISEARQLIQVKAPVLSRRRRVLANAFNVEEYRKSAQKVLPAGIFDYLDGGSEDEVTLRRNRAVFDSWALMPSWGPVSGPDTGTTLLGKEQCPAADFDPDRAQPGCSIPRASWPSRPPRTGPASPTGWPG